MLTLMLLPLSWLYAFLFYLRGRLFRLGVLKTFTADVPVIVVGNITVGGTGKTPLTIYLIELLRNYGFTPGVISRGYGSEAERYPYSVRDDSPVAQSGDEPALIVKRTQVPLVIGADRKSSVQALLKAHPTVDVILSDDGLQHLALDRDVELCVLNDSAANSNQHLFPAGPYRESTRRLNTVDLIVRNGSADESGRAYGMKLVPSEPRPVNTSDAIAKNEFNPTLPVQAVAGIGNPERFFNTCRDLGWSITEVVYQDHHKFKPSDIDFGSMQVLMTEKDAVKCKEFSNSNHWYLPVNAKLSNQFNERLIELVKSAASAKNTH